MAKPVSPRLSRAQSHRQLTLKQERFVREFALSGNGTDAARKAGYKPGPGISSMAHENLKKPEVAAAVQREIERVDLEISANRIQRRLHDISLAAQDAGQFGPAVRAEELLGKSIG